MVSSNPQLYDQLIEITTQLLGPASERFVDRQIINHLQIEPQALQPKDISRLADWLRLGISVLTDDAEMVQSYVQQLRELETGSTIHDHIK